MIPYFIACHTHRQWLWGDTFGKVLNKKSYKLLLLYAVMFETAADKGYINAIKSTG